MPYQQSGYPKAVLPCVETVIASRVSTKHSATPLMSITVYGGGGDTIALKQVLCI